MNEHATQQPTPRLLANMGLNLETPPPPRESLDVPARSGVRKKYIFHIAGREFITGEAGFTALLDAVRHGDQPMIEIQVGIPNEDKSFLMWINVRHVLFIRPGS